MWQNLAHAERPEKIESRPVPGRSEMKTAISQTGSEWLVDAAGCDALRLSDLPHLQATCAELVDALRLRVIGEAHWHQFPAPQGEAQPGGVTGLYLLAESHLTCHTFPEFRRAAFNLYCCRGRPAWDWKEFLARRLGATDVVVQSVTRGLVKASAQLDEARR
jgi:S-adenosylmethionine decarboxylase